MTATFRWRTWAVVGLLTLLWHLLLTLFPWNRWFTMRPPELDLPRIEITQVDPAKLEAIRKQWRDKSLLISKDPNAPKTQVSPTDDARYLSDRTIRVEKEQRAAETSVIPQAQPGTEAGGADVRRTQTPQAAQIQDLSKLGIPFRFGERPRPPKEKADSDAPNQRSGGAQQSILDRNLPVGAENMLNADETVHYSFFSRIYDRVGRLWQSKIQSLPRRPEIPEGDYTTAVEIVLDRSGELVDVVFLQRSGVAEFDKIVEEVWRRLERFPNPPTTLIKEDGRVHTAWTFVVSVGQNVGMQFSREY